MLALLVPLVDAVGQTAPQAASRTPLEMAAQSASPKVLDEHVRADIARHRAMAAAHEAAARCLASGQPEAACVRALQLACKGLAIGKHCGMRHAH